MEQQREDTTGPSAPGVERQPLWVTATVPLLLAALAGVMMLAGS